MIILNVIILIFVIIANLGILKILNCLSDKSEKENNEEEQQRSNIKRVHSSIAKVDFENQLQGRGYDKYKNKDGLYEPVTGKAGINLNQAKGE